MRLRQSASLRPRLEPVAKGISLAKLAKIAGGELVGGDSSIIIEGIAEIERAKAGDITYAVNKHYLEKLRTSHASAVVVGSDVPRLDRPFIRCHNPYWSFAKILEYFQPEPPRPDVSISPIAYVSRKARLGKDVVIRPYAVVEDDVVVGDRTVIESGVHVGYGSQIGSDCVINPHVTICSRSVIGDRVLIHPNSVIGADGYGFAFKDGAYTKIPQIGIVIVEDDVEIGACVTIDRATLGRTLIGRGCKIDNLVQIGHNVEIGENTMIVAQVGISGSTRIGKNCRIAGQAGTVGHIKVGDNCTLTARSVVTKDLAANSCVAGFPARPLLEDQRITAALRKLPEALRRIRSLENRTETATESDEGDVQPEGGVGARS